MSNKNVETWNVSMDDDFFKRFENYRKKFKRKNYKGQLKILNRSEFARHMFEYWEAKYLELVEPEKIIKELQKEVSNLNKEIDYLKENHDREIDRLIPKAG